MCWMIMDTADMSGSESTGIEVILKEGEFGNNPFCPHGPTMLFVKMSKGEQQGRAFYACSACRDRKDCNFFQWEDEKISKDRLLAREEENKAKQPPFTHSDYCSRYLQFISLPLEQKRFCQDCQLLLLPEDWAKHTTHNILPDITTSQLRRPSQLLCPLENKKTNAQYLFADRSCHFLLNLFAALGFRKVLCVGTPRLHELIKIRNMCGDNQIIKSLLLDIDFRYSQFYTEDEFCHYNMFNHHFFNGKAAEDVFNSFLSEGDGAKVVMVADPPFGGLVKPLAYSFALISSKWKTLQPPDKRSQEMPMFWIFPYFFESRILECFPTFSMLDYQVDYDNHPLYKHGKTGRRQSPVRMFTNLCPKLMALPAEEGYRFCSLCQRYVSSENKHCLTCNACTSKDGRSWKHCSLCNKCVKPSWVHCTICNQCALKDHPCGKLTVGCFICKGADHKRRACPKAFSSKDTRLGKQAAGKKAKVGAEKDVPCKQTAGEKRAAGIRLKKRRKKKRKIA
ncbi:rRNA N6-adenosine-methyltransferase ZCCHC4 [Lepisosteus oculatus]|uniref:Zinc finger, CCHC domain containing 4 n=1 Tax=Lepisosteus oculatus TaxID=7918 RepID=W5N6E8_LEPOC|nr:PREDICTED: zinc finger CCHC domain-containing protein 4 [Lepisosteus oculatus]